MPDEDRRSAFRSPLVGVRATFESSNGESQTGEVFDLSRGGLFLETHAPLPVGKRLALEIHADGEAAPWPALGRVVWVRGADAPTERPHGMGIKLIDVEDEVAEAIERLVSMREPTESGLGPISISGFTDPPAEPVTSRQPMASDEPWAAPLGAPLAAPHAPAAASPAAALNPVHLPEPAAAPKSDPVAPWPTPSDTAALGAAAPSGPSTPRVFRASYAAMTPPDGVHAETTVTIDLVAKKGESRSEPPPPSRAERTDEEDTPPKRRRGGWVLLALVIAAAAAGYQYRERIESLWRPASPVAPAP